MATSGTIGSTTADVSTILEHSFRRCGQLASSISAEQQLSAKENLFFMLSDLANRGISLWCVQKNILGVALNQKVYNLPIGTVDVLRANYRNASFVGTPASASALVWSTDSGSGETNAVTTIGVLSATAQTLTLVVETSSDNSSWITLYTPAAFTTVSGLTYWFDVEPTTTSRYWRIRETVLPALTLTTAKFGFNTNEIPMSPYNRDDYVNLPNKDFSSSRPLQYWYDKQYAVPRLWLWPVPNDITTQMVVWTQRHIQDVGALSNTLEIPQRWYEAIIFLLAEHVALEIPPEKLPPGRLEYLAAKAEYHLKRAEDGETDGAPLRIVPQIGYYTR